MASRRSEEAQNSKEESAACFRAHVVDPEYGGTARQFDDGEICKLLRKVDWRVLPILSFLYMLAFWDRSNLGNARIAGLEDDLRLVGNQYNLASTVQRTMNLMETMS